MELQKQIFTAILLTSLLFSGGVKAQDPISNNNNFGEYSNTGQNVILNKKSTPNNNVIDGNLNFVGGFDNDLGTNNVLRSSFTYGRSNVVTANNNNDPSFVFGEENEATEGRNYILGTDNTINTFEAFAIGDGVEATNSGGANIGIGEDVRLDNIEAFGFGRNIDVTGRSAYAIGLGASQTDRLVNSIDNSITLGTEAQNQFNLNPNGNVSIGTNSSPRNAPDSKLEIRANGSSSSTSALEILDNSGNSLIFVRDDGNVGIGTSSPSEKLVVDGNIKNNGDVLPGNVSSGNLTLGRSGNRWYTVWTQTNQINGSDRRLKSNIDSLTYGMEEIMQLNPVSYKLKDREKGDTHLGLIAQQLEKVIQEPVETGEGEKQLKGVRYPSLIPVLINGMQEQQKQVQKQQDEIKELKANLEQEKAENEALEEKVNQLSERVNQLAEQVNGVSESFKKADDESLNQKTATLSNEDADQAMLLQNRPNPYSNETVIPYYLPENAQNANMLITNTQGQMLKRIPLEGTGKGELTLKTADLNQGQYQYTLIIDGQQIQTRKMIVK